MPLHLYVYCKFTLDLFHRYFYWIFFISFVSCFQYHSDFTGFDPRGLKTIGDVGEERSISELQILPEALPGRCPVNRRR